MFGKKKSFKEKIIKKIEKKKVEIRKIQSKADNEFENAKKRKYEKKIQLIEEEIRKMAKVALKDGKLVKVDEIKKDEPIEMVKPEDLAKLAGEEEPGNNLPPPPPPPSPPVADREPTPGELEAFQKAQQQIEIAQMQAKQEANKVAEAQQQAETDTRVQAQQQAAYQQAQLQQAQMEAQQAKLQMPPPAPLPSGMQQQPNPEELFPPELLQQPQAVQRPLPQQVPPQEFVQQMNIPEYSHEQEVKVKVVLVGGMVLELAFEGATFNKNLKAISEAINNNESIQLGNRIFNSRNILFLEF